jgi:alpha-L-arabinofuranosidase
LFLDPSQVWLQPPGYVTQMLSSTYLPQVLECDVTATGARIDAVARRSEDGKKLVLQVVNTGDSATDVQINLAGFTPVNAKANVAELSGPLDAVNTAASPATITPRHTQWAHGLTDGKTHRTFPPHSFTVIQFE